MSQFFFFVSLGVASVLLVSCGGDSRVATPSVAPTLIEKRLIDAEVASLQKHRYDLICHSAQKNVRGKPTIGFLALRLDGKGKDDAIKLTDHDGFFLWSQLENGALVGHIANAFNVKFTKRHVSQNDSRLMTTVFFLGGFGSPTNYTLLVVDRHESKEGVQLAARTHRSALQPGASEDGEVLTCPVANLN